KSSFTMLLARRVGVVTQGAVCGKFGCELLDSARRAAKHGATRLRAVYIWICLISSRHRREKVKL
ncbi:hypothetical protein A2U01_0064006, partial [Trifolium medium]|nr:hypothetical protein [Trifolium medium]